jgi:hypothetical protein
VVFLGARFTLNPPLKVETMANARVMAGNIDGIELNTLFYPSIITFAAQHLSEVPLSSDPERSA